jgi:hypothetical protein
MRFLLIIFIFIATTNAQATLYKYINKDGEIIYSDKPPYPGAEQMTPPLLQTIPAIKYKAPPKAKTTANPTHTKYRALTVSQPKAEQTIRNNSGNITIALKLEPELDIKNGHYINIYLNGRIIKKQTHSLSMSLKNIDRGSHNIKAEVRNKKGKLLKSSPINTFYLHRFSKLHRPAAPPKKSP